MTLFAIEAQRATCRAAYTSRWRRWRLQSGAQVYPSEGMGRRVTRRGRRGCFFFDQYRPFRTSIADELSVLQLSSTVQEAVLRGWENAMGFTPRGLPFRPMRASTRRLRSSSWLAGAAMRRHSTVARHDLTVSE